MTDLYSTPTRVLGARMIDLYSTSVFGAFMISRYRHNMYMPISMC